MPQPDDNVKTCPSCHKRFPISSIVCDADGALLIMIQKDKVSSRLGEVIGGRFELMNLIGTGGSSLVFRARDSATGNEVAIKIVDQDRFGKIQRERLAQRFAREQDVTEKLGKHPNIVLMVASGKDFIATEIIDGINLSDAISELPDLGSTYFISIFGQLCEALEHAHGLNIIHGDLKPNDIILTEAENGSLQVKLLDFGKGPALLHSDNQDQQLTERGDIFGDPRYMSLEQCHNQILDARSNIYSVGCMMFEALTGVVPFDGTHWGAVLLKKNSGRRPDTSSIDSEVLSSPLMAVTNKAMAFEPESRFQSAAELRQELLKQAGSNTLPLVSFSDIKECIEKKKLSAQSGRNASAKSWLEKFFSR